MLSSFPLSKRGGDKNKGDKKDQQKGKREERPKVFVPAKFYGELTDADHVWVEQPKTFEIPLGVPVDPIFEYIRTNQYTKIQPILKDGYNLNKKLFNEVYLRGLLAIYYGNPKAVSDFKAMLVNALNTLTSENKQTLSLAQGAANYLQSNSKITTPVFIKAIRDSMDEEISEAFNHNFDNDPINKANAILSSPVRNWISSLILKLINLNSTGGRDPTEAEKADLDSRTAAWKLMPPSDERTAVGESIKEDRQRIKEETSLDVGTEKCGHFEHQDNIASCGRHALNNIYFDKNKEFINLSKNENPQPVIDLSNPAFPLSLPHFCTKLSVEAKKAGAPDIFNCEDSENYNITTLQYAIYYAGDDFEDYPTSKLKELNDALSKRNNFSMIINLKTKPAETKPAETKPAETKPAENISKWKHTATYKKGDSVTYMGNTYKYIGETEGNNIPGTFTKKDYTGKIIEPKLWEKVSFAGERYPKWDESAKYKKQSKIFYKGSVYEYIGENDSNGKIKDTQKWKKLAKSTKPDSPAIIGKTVTESSSRLIPTKDDSLSSHWVSAISDGVKNCYYDSLKTQPLHFQTKEELIDYIFGLNTAHFILIKETDTPIDIKTKLKELGPSTKIIPETDESKIKQFLKEFIKDVQNKYETEFEALTNSISTQYGIVQQTGGDYTGPKHKTYEPDTSQNLLPPEWYRISPKSMNNITPLQYAVGYGSVDSVRVLIRNGADFTVTTLNGITLENLANSRKDNDLRTKDVQRLLQYIFAAYSAADTDHDARKMKDDYVTESNLTQGQQNEKDLLNFIYTKTYKALKKGKLTTEVLGEVGESAKKKGREDGLKGTKDNDKATDSSQEIREGYNLGYKIGEAEKIGQEDGRVKGPKRGLYTSDNLDIEIRNAYNDAYNKAKGKYVYSGFKDGITGKEKKPPSSGFLKFDEELSKALQFGEVNKDAENDYEIGFGYGSQKFYKELKNIIGNAESDGRLDGYNGKKKYETKYIIKTKPVFGASVSPENPTEYQNITFGSEEEKYEVDYGKLDQLPRYKTRSDIVIDTAKATGGVPASEGNTGYGAYIKILYDTGYQTGINDQEKKGGLKNKTYRKKRSTKSKTYKKKLVKK